MNGRVEGPGLGPPEPPEGPDGVRAPAGPEAVSPAARAEPVAGISPLAHEVRRILAEAATAGVDNHGACETLVGRLLEGLVSDDRREEVVRHVTDQIVDDPVLSQIINNLRQAPPPQE